METWRSVLALAAAGALITGPAFAQGGGSTSPSGSESTQPGGTSKPGDTSSPSGSPSTTPGGQSEQSQQSGGDQSGTAKSDKSGAGKGEQAGRSGGQQQQVKAAQQALKDKGHDPGSVDGVMGPRTQSALKQFQQAEGLQATGRLDAETISKLGVSEGGESSPSASPSTSPSTPDGDKPAGGSETPGAGSKQPEQKQ